MKLFKGGFSTGHGVLREPNDIQSYSALACIAIQSNQNDQHGGQSIVNFDYGLAHEENVIVVCGGRNDQQTAHSKSRDFFEKEKSGKTIGVLAPFYATSEEDYAAELEKVEPLIWKGYALGFVRTACWNCPFQKHEQWEALKKHYPLLWEAMRKQSIELKFQKISKDSIKRKFEAYWKKQLPLDSTEAKDG